MAKEAARTGYWLGVRHGAPFVIVVAPFAVLFGVVATEAGLNLTEVMGFSVLVIAGASQFAALQLMSENAPTVIILATALAVNLRMAMYSAALAPHLGAAPFWLRGVMAYFLVDQSYAVSAVRFDTHPDMTLSQKVGYYFGVMTPIAPLWYVMTFVGAVAGTQIPPEFALDFAVPITFLAMIAPGLRTAAHLAAALVSVTVALALAFLPSGGALLIAGFAAMVTGAQVELWLKRRGKWT